MNTNLPMNVGKSFIDKIKNFFKKLFWKKENNNLEESDIVIEKEIASDEVVSNVETIEETRKSFHDSIRVEAKNEYVTDMKREEFLKEIEANPSLLYELPVEKLEKLEKYYDDSISEYQEKLSKLKNAG